jgi:phospholipase C
LYADGNLNKDGSKFVLRMTAGNAVHGKHTVGAPFNVHLHNTKEKQTPVATYTVKPGDSLQEEFPLVLFAGGKYSIDVHGPNGFYRSFAGEGHSSEVRVRAAYERRGALLTGNVQLTLINAGEQPVLIAVEDESYRTGTVTKKLAGREKASLVLKLQHNHCWYDFTVKAQNSLATARFAGRVETGQSSFSDPLMGGAVSA